MGRPGRGRGSDSDDDETFYHRYSTPSSTTTTTSSQSAAATSGSRKRGGGVGGGGGSGGLAPSKSTVYISNLDFNLTNSDLFTLFSTFGKVARVTVLKDRATRRSRGVAFILFVDRDSAVSAARQMNGKVLNGRTLAASIASDNGRAPEFIRRRVYKDKSRCYECGEEGHLSYECPKNQFGPRERPPPPKKGRSENPQRRRKDNKAAAEDEEEEEERDWDGGGGGAGGGGDAFEDDNWASVVDSDADRRLLMREKEEEEKRKGKKKTKVASYFSDESGEED